MITEIEIEGVGTYRLPDEAQGLRLRHMHGARRDHAQLAFPLGLTVARFKKLPAEKQRAVWKAFARLTAPNNVERI